MAEGRWACDTSVAIAALDPNHEGHPVSRARVLQTRPALAGHAAFETYAVLTRMPPPLRLTGPQAAEVISRAFPDACWLNPRALGGLLGKMAELSIVGGAVYDGLVGQAALHEGRTLLTRDGRAERTYRSLGVDYEFIG